MRTPRRLDDVDAALESARRETADAALPPALRARILAAARPTAALPPRLRLVDVALRAAAVAAVVAAGLTVMPTSLEASDFDAKPLVEWNARIADAVAERLPRLDVAPEIGTDAAWPFAAAAAALVVGGVLLARRGGRT